MPKPATTPTTQRRDIVIRNMTLRRETVNAEARTVDAVIVTENRATVMDMMRWEPIEEIILIDGLDISRQVPLLESHDRYSTDSVHGSIRNLRKEGKQIVGTLYFATDPDSEIRWQKVRDGHVTDISAGVRSVVFTDIPAGEQLVVNGQTYQANGLTLRITQQSILKEGSLVAIGADPDATTRKEPGPTPPNSLETTAMNQALRNYLLSLGLRAEATDQEATTFLNNLTGTQRAYADTLKTPETVRAAPAAIPAPAPTAPAAVVSTTTVDPATARAEAVQAERGRVRSIRELAGTDVPGELVTRAVDEGWDTARASQEFLTAIRAGRTPAVAGSAGPAIHSRSHEQDCTVRALATGLMLRNGVRVIDPAASNELRRQQEQEAEQGNRYRSMSALDICREALRLEGRRYGYDRDETIRAAVSTGALNAIFTTSVNARLLQAYAEEVDTTIGWCAEADVPDFKTNDRISLGKSAELDRLARGKGANHATQNSATESYRIARYAKQFAIDDQDMIDDNLGALRTQPDEIGMSARRLRPNLVYSILLNNAALGDTGLLFNATAVTTAGGHANLATGAGSPLSSTSLIAAIIAMGKQTQDGVNLNLRPRFLMVPQDLRFTALALLRSAEVRDTTASTKYPTYNALQDETIEVRTDNRIGVAGCPDPTNGNTVVAGTATNWFLSAGPFRTIEVGYLLGTGRAPMTRSWVMDREGRYGIGWDVKMDIGAKALDYRGLYKSAGA